MFKYLHTHTHTYTYIDTYTHVCVCVCIYDIYTNVRAKFHTVVYQKPTCVAFAQHFTADFGGLAASVEILAKSVPPSLYSAAGTTGNSVAKRVESLRIWWFNRMIWGFNGIIRFVAVQS